MVRQDWENRVRLRLMSICLWLSLRFFWKNSPKKACPRLLHSNHKISKQETRAPRAQVIGYIHIRQLNPSIIFAQNTTPAEQMQSSNSTWDQRGLLLQQIKYGGLPVRFNSCLRRRTLKRLGVIAINIDRNRGVLRRTNFTNKLPGSVKR